MDSAERYRARRKGCGALLLMGLFATQSGYALDGGPVPLQELQQGQQGQHLELQRQQQQEAVIRQQNEPQAASLQGSLRGSLRGSSPGFSQMEAPDASVPLEYPRQEAPCFVIRHIELTGEAAEAFQFALRDVLDAADSPLHRCLGATGINVVMSRVQNAIMQRGFITTRVLAPSQNLQSGRLVLQLLPGRVQAMRRVDDAPSAAQLWMALPSREGSLLNLRDMEQGLENLKRLPTVEADIQVAPAGGALLKPGESDLAVRWRQAFPWRFSATLDDSGSEHTGKYQGSATFSYDNPFGLNDLFYITAAHDLNKGPDQPRGTQGYFSHYSLPWGYWLLSFAGSRNGYHQSVAGATQTYLYSGRSTHQEAKLARVLYRSAQRKTSASLRGYARTSRNYVDDTEIEVQRRRMAGWQAELSHREYIGPVTLSGSYSYLHGTGAMSSLQAPEALFGEGTARPVLRNASLQLSWPFQVMRQALRINSDWRAQWNDTAPLVPLDRFSIGGRYTVRGFDGEQSLSAERGFVWRNELSLPLFGSGQEFYLALDAGRVDGPSARALLGKSLAGTALGLRGGAGGFSYDVFVSRPIQQPAGFRSVHTPVGFSLNYSY